MAEEVKQTEQPVIRGWKDVALSENMPLNVLVNFFNVLNQRLVTLENITQVPFDNRMVSITEMYAIQAAQEAAAREQTNAPSNEQKDN